MIYFAFIVGMLLPTGIGWIAIRLLEQDTPVFSSVERCVLGHICGITLTMYLFFFVHVIGLLQLTLSNFLLICTIVLIGLGVLWMHTQVFWNVEPVQKKKPPVHSRTMSVCIGVLSGWALLKIVTAGMLLIGSPPYLDDVVSNWNMRGKVFFTTQQLTLFDSGISSYPPTVPLFKTWLASLAGQWHEGLVNAPHIVWYLSALALVFFYLRRQLHTLWALLGVYILSSLPLYLLHGASAYADIFLSLHVFAALSLLASAVTADTAKKKCVFLRCSCLFGALLVLTKNEALLLHLPVFLLLFILSIRWMRQREDLNARQAQNLLLQGVYMLLCTALPWLLFKWHHDLPFGNAKPISGLGLEWQQGVAHAIWINTFFEGNWVFLFPLLIGLILLRWKSVLRGPVLLFVVYFVLVFGEQMPIYFFTGLSTEALRQTGYARGLIQLVPAAVVAVILLLHSVIQNTDD
jgi:hypothetical protein